MPACSAAFTTTPSHFSRTPRLDRAGACEHLLADAALALEEHGQLGGLDYAGFVGVDATNLYGASVGSQGLYVTAKIGGGMPALKLGADRSVCGQALDESCRVDLGRVERVRHALQDRAVPG